MDELFALTREGCELLPLVDGDDVLDAVEEVSRVLLDHVALREDRSLAPLVGLPAGHLILAHAKHLDLDVFDEVEGDLAHLGHLLGRQNLDGLVVVKGDHVMDLDVEGRVDLVKLVLLLGAHYQLHFMEVVVDF